MPFEQPPKENLGFPTGQAKFEKAPKETEGEQKSIKSEKEIIWDNRQKEIEETKDALGKKIDERIKETAIAFNVMELPTSGSCEGHIDRGIIAPWVEVSAPNEPEERFKGEKEIFQKVADKYGIPFEEVKRGIHQEAWTEAIKESSKNEETPEYKQWRKENKKLKKRTKSLLEEFYKDRKVSPNLKLTISEGGEGVFRVHNGGKDYRPVPENLTEKQRHKLTERLSKYQKEMKNFTKFLRDKYFEE